MHHRTPWTWSSVLALTEVEDLEPLVGILVVLVVIFVWSRAQNAPVEETKLGLDRTPAPSESSRPRSGKSVVWLGALAAAATVLLAFQGALGWYSGSLTLLADMGHAAGDTVTYLAAYVVERAKHDLTTRKGASGSAAWIDALGGTASTLLVAGVSINAMVDAVHRLQSKAPEREGEDIGLIGPAILTFAIGSLAVNLALLAFRAREEEEPTEDEVAPPQPPVAANPETEPPPPPPPAFPSQRPARTRAPRTAGRAAKATFASPAVPTFAAAPPPPSTVAVPSVEAAPLPSPVAAPTFEAPPPPPPPPPSVDDAPPPRQQRAAREVSASSTNWLRAAFRPACEGCDDEACKSEEAEVPSTDGAPSPKQKKQAPTWWQRLHSALHPGCDGCGDEACQSGAADAAQKDKEEKEKNLNLYGATLHLATDVVRSIIILFTGFLLRAGILVDVARTDAVCALVVGLCVLLGSAAFFYAPLVKLLSKPSSSEA